jgi:hypothetical protein
MTVQVTEEDPKTNPFYRFGIESCVKCETPTRFWWAGGCMPLCPACAKTVTREWCIKFAKDNRYGPLPAKQYRDQHKARNHEHI